ncbi:MAG: glycosyltransferase, partial [Bacteroidota bacterium]
MKPLLVSTSPDGGAAKACLRLHHGLKREGVKSHLLFGKAPHLPSFQEYSVIKAKSPHIHLSLKNWINEKVHKSEEKRLALIKEQAKFIKSRPKGLDIFGFPNAEVNIVESAAYQNADLINLHWVAGLLDYERFFSRNRKPVVWTLHDMNPFSGGEHYEEQYLGITEEGKPKKRIFSVHEIEKQKEIINFKRKTLPENLHVVALSKWIMKASKNSQTFNQFPHYQIPNGIDTNNFQPRNRKFSREILGITEDKTVLLFVATSLRF